MGRYGGRRAFTPPRSFWAELRAARWSALRASSARFIYVYYVLVEVWCLRSFFA